MARNRSLGVFDFDGTVANTFADSPNGINVTVATTEAVKQIFGEEGFAVFMAQGGMKNREPGEMVQDIRRDLGLGDDVYHETTKQFIDAKLGILIPEINENWPEPAPGVKELFMRAQEGSLPIDIAIASSGHDGFIEQWFRVNGIPRPNIIVTSDIIRARPEPQRERFKPYTYQFAEVHRRWEGRSYNGSVDWNEELYTGRHHHKDKMFYVGDDPVKDGGLALNVRIPYVHVPFSGRQFDPDETKGQLTINDFTELTDILDAHSQALREGASFAEVFFGRSDAELFPPRTPEGARGRMEEVSVNSRRERL